MSVDPYDFDRRLCDDYGMVSEELYDDGGLGLYPGMTYLGQLNNLRSHSGFPQVDRPFNCTGSAHLAGAHIRCTSPAHHHPVTFPHCDPQVLHSPGVCIYCDRYPSWQDRRAAAGVNFTGVYDPAKEICPSQRERSLDTINRWGGNRPQRPDAGPTIEVVE